MPEESRQVIDGREGCEFGRATQRSLGAIEDDVNKALPKLGTLWTVILGVNGDEGMVGDMRDVKKSLSRIEKTVYTGIGAVIILQSLAVIFREQISQVVAVATAALG